MSAAQAASLPTVLLPTPSSGKTTPRPEDPRPPGDGWQRAFETATQDDRPTVSLADEAARLLVLGNLESAPDQASSTWFSAKQKADIDPRRPGSEGVMPRANEARSMSTLAARADTPRAADATMAAVDSPVADVWAPRTPMPGQSFRDTATDQVARDPAAPQQPRVFSQLPARAPASMAIQGIASYVAAMSSASMPTDRPLDFTLVSRASTLPVRVHVQWRERVADVWIGLHRKAFDQLPDIRAGVTDWVVSRGGVLGRVVCNGETLSGVLPIPSFPGAF